MKNLDEIPLDKDWKGYFGCCEFEELAQQIIFFLKKDYSLGCGTSNCYDRGFGWERQYIL